MQKLKLKPLKKEGGKKRLTFETERVCGAFRELHGGKYHTEYLHIAMGTVVLQWLPEELNLPKDRQSPWGQQCYLFLLVDIWAYSWVYVRLSHEVNSYFSQEGTIFLRWSRFFLSEAMRIECWFKTQLNGLHLHTCTCMATISAASLCNNQQPSKQLL